MTDQELSNIFECIILQLGLGRWGTRFDPSVGKCTKDIQNSPKKYWRILSK
jgi:hypothetical protein